MIAPRVGARWPARIFISVDLPAPFSPMIAWTSPARTLTETSLKTSIGPNERDKPTASRTGPSGPAPARFFSPASDMRPRWSKRPPSKRVFFVFW